jgi:hypothetical protein|mmetsp:Transcript_6531/g.10463  ORF Transcript_6531/g.10463 Transcript_6531/m.10463 type:complete len:473 (-) Transcript_6531:65-1483(-)|eukprot:CAMPEP_0169144920 /NCGR_PEP_ID=MMETSP1015-20121227/46575_1 /TAXON_ID=342587 /ORGANISM="Karlodinium micrum, Strain CCMP2283" /LENGTH=472 /DNA_ID=CAMNT_0009212355 /DNA_START=76 /DNA_END=1494 /DNA_ORIENTATION=-
MSLASFNVGSHMAATFLPGGALNLTVMPDNRSLLTPSLIHHHHHGHIFGPPLPQGFVAAPIASSAAIGLSGRRDRLVPARVHRVTASEAGELVAKKKAMIRNARTLVARSHSARLNKPMFGGAVLQLVARSFAAVGLVMQRCTLDDSSTAYLRGLGIIVYLVASIPNMLSVMIAPAKMLMLLSSVEPFLVAFLTYLLRPQESALFSSQQATWSLLCFVGIFGYIFFSGGAAFSLEIVGDEVPATIYPGSEGILLTALERSLMYLAIALPCLMFFVWKARQCYHEMETSGIARFPLSFPITVALSSALQHLALIMLGLFMTSTDVVHKSPVVPILLCVVAVACMVCGSFHVCRGVTQAPPDIFVTMCYAMGSLFQMFQSAVIFREYHEPTKKAIFSASSILVVVFGLVQLHLSQGRVKKIRYAGGIFGRVAGVDASSLGSIEPHAFSEEEVLAGKPSGKLPAWVTAWRFLGRA